MFKKKVMVLVLKDLEDIKLPKGWKPFSVVYHEKQWLLWCEK